MKNQNILAIILAIIMLVLMIKGVSPIISFVCIWIFIFFCIATGLLKKWL